MEIMTSIERITNILQRKPVDRIGLLESFWGDTKARWVSEGHVKAEENLDEHFGFDIARCGPFKMVADLNFQEQIIEEDEETVLAKNGNYATMRRHKLHSSTPEHIDFDVKDRKAWEEKIKPKLIPTKDRIAFEVYREAKKKAAESKRFFCWAGTNVFELMHPVCGHEYMLMGMAIDPDWVKDMVDTYSSLIIGLMEILFAEEGKPDGFFFYEDMGFKNRPFMSPEMYKEIVCPGHKKTFDYCHSLGLQIIVHSCGYIEPLVPHLIEAGMDCLQVIEIKAGMDLLKLYKQYGDQIGFCGGMDARNLVSNDLDKIKIELEEKIPVVKKNFNYILHSDHSIPDTTNYETYRFFVDKGLELGTY